MEKPKGKSTRGFGSMDENRQREIARQGGRASAQSNTSNRGFASMDKQKQREISSQGGKASQGGTGKTSRGATGRNEQSPSALSEQNEKVQRDIEYSQRDLNSLEEEKEVANNLGQASVSETDEDEDEGLGDGNMGRSKRSRGFDEES
ncbi:MAG TPA: KGG domain-containing protein [Chryseosolibacter sp.]